MIKSYQDLIKSHLKKLDHIILHCKNLLAEDEIIEVVFLDALTDSPDDQMVFNFENLLKMISQLNLSGG
jgi:hypothetical protein